MEHILRIQKSVEFDETISHYEMHAHQPLASSSFGNNDEISITVQHQDLCLLPSKSHLHIHGRLTKENGTTPVERTRLVNNAISHLFEDIRYELNGMEIDRAKNVGLTSLMKNYISQSPNQWSLMENAGIVNAKHELVLTRSKTDVNVVLQRPITVANPEEKYKITLQKIEWLIPYIKISDKRKTARKTPTTNASTFDHCNMRDVKLFSNSQSYPYGNLNLDINHNQCSTLYNMYVNFQDSFYGKKMEPLLSRSEFLEKAPLIVVDCSKQNEYLKSGPVDIRIEFEPASPFPPHTSAYCLILHDRIVQYNPISGGIKS
ncbi:uncharacterized protein [Fopius arisanus]|uniref:Double jelly roll-like domain-containing protein n=1 Tax=Fopius arisanus TaxID=64838 RepID=A0A9R1TPM6_9HYME|nr:PREDICTED: uncharacterized protein LOC105272783 [Fopius arisanus]